MVLNQERKTCKTFLLFVFGRFMRKMKMFAVYHGQMLLQPVKAKENTEQNSQWVHMYTQ